jgi:hypothetical protein
MIPPFPLQDPDFWIEVKLNGISDADGEKFRFSAGHCFILVRSEESERLVGIVSPEGLLLFVPYLFFGFRNISEYSGITGIFWFYRNIPEYSGIF